MANQAKNLSYYERLILKIKEQIMHGVLLPEDKLPSLREMAVRERLNPNTVAKAYKQLESEGVIYVQPGRGTFVADRQISASPEQLRDLRQRFTELVLEGQTLGVDVQQMQAWVQTSVEDQENDNQSR